MSDHSEHIKFLETRVAFLEKHVADQDAEIYQLTKRIDTLVKIFKEQKSLLAAVAEMNSGTPGDMPADEKPPHY